MKSTFLAGESGGALSVAALPAFAVCEQQLFAASGKGALAWQLRDGTIRNATVSQPFCLFSGFLTKVPDDSDAPLHPVEDVSRAYRDPEKFIDYAYRAGDLTTLFGDVWKFSGDAEEASNFVCMERPQVQNGTK